ncbi:MAG TPA: endonuclease V [Methanomicrobia archaeon]|nr:endonuclease V [Methanomicrobia archaeon]
MSRELTTEELYGIQEEIAARALITDTFDPGGISLIAGADQAFFLDSAGEEKIISAIVLLDYPDLQVLECAYAVLPVEFPYIPGLLAFREAPALIAAFRKLATRPDLLVIDGGGINHPRFAGLATHVGVLLDIPTIGVTKKLLCGSGELPTVEGDARVIRYENREVGYYLTSKTGCRPIIVAPGHKIALQTALQLMKACIRKHKLPEPVRIAHRSANHVKRTGTKRRD